MEPEIDEPLTCGVCDGPLKGSTWCCEWCGLATCHDCFGFGEDIDDMDELVCSICIQENWSQFSY